MSNSLQPHEALPGSSVHGIPQARILEWVTMPCFRGSSWPKDQTHLSCLLGRFFTLVLPGNPEREYTSKVLHDASHKIWASLVTQLIKNLPAKGETWIRSLDWEDPLEKGKATHSSILAWRIPQKFPLYSPWGCKE